MCGWIGLFGFEEHSLSHLQLRSALMALAARGPDGEGLWGESGVWLGHRRLAVIDPDRRAIQPMASACGRYRIVFNGEIYNYRLLREYLQKRYGPILWRTESDTETILEGFIREGNIWWSRLRGMFSIAIWDRVLRKLTVARDPLGIKPLYFSNYCKGLAVASTVKSLLALGCDAEPNNRGWASFFLWGAVQEPLTIYRDINAVPAGCYGEWDENQGWTFNLFVDPNSPWVNFEKTPERIAERISAAVHESVKTHLVADVPIAVLLSGGIDSTVVAAIAAEFGSKMVGFTITFSEWLGKPQDEAPLASLAARYYGYSHCIALPTIEDFTQDCESILAAMDQPTVDGFNTWYAAQAVARGGFKVVLSGLGGDELFAGYATFRRIPLFWDRWKRITQLIGNDYSLKLLHTYGRLKERQKWQHADLWLNNMAGWYFIEKAVFYPDEVNVLLATMGLPSLPEEETQQLAIELPSSAASHLQAVGQWETQRYMRSQLLRDCDWASMAHGVELRVPLADWELICSLAPLQPYFRQGQGKKLLAQAPKKPLPRDIVKRNKWGFVTPIAQWLKHRQDWPRKTASGLPPLDNIDRQIAWWVACQHARLSIQRAGRYFYFS